MEPLDQESTLRQAIWEIVQSIPAIDPCARIAGPEGTLRSGPDALAHDPELMALARRARPGAVAPLPDTIWDALFREQAPLAEAPRCLWRSLTDLGVPVESNRWDSWRQMWSSSGPALWLDRAMAAAGLRHAFVPLDPTATLSAHGLPNDERLRPSLDLDTLMHNWKQVQPKLVRFGYAVDRKVDKSTQAEIRRFLRDAILRWQPAALVVSLPGSFRLDRSDAAKILEKAILPVARDCGRPMMLTLDELPDFAAHHDERPFYASSSPTVASGVLTELPKSKLEGEGAPSAVDAPKPMPKKVTRGSRKTTDAADKSAPEKAGKPAKPGRKAAATVKVATPLMKAKPKPSPLSVPTPEADASDGSSSIVMTVEPLAMRRVEEICALWPGVKFLVSSATPDSQAALARLSLSREHVTVFGAAGSMPEALLRAYRLRLEALGARCLLGGGAAHTLEGLVGAWRRIRWLAAVALQDRYCDLLRAGWLATRSDIERDASALLGGAFPGA